MTRSPRDRFGFTFITLAHHWRRAIESELAKAGLTDASWRPLIHLSEGGDDISQSHLATRIGLDTSSLVRLLDLLESRGLIERRIDPDDRRARRLILTPAGHAAVTLIQRRVLEIEHQLLAEIDDEELAHMMSGFGAISRKLRDKSE